jgi:hypothetical protein
MLSIYFWVYIWGINFRGDYDISSSSSLPGAPPSWIFRGVSNLVVQMLEPYSIYSFLVTTLLANSFRSEAIADPPSHAHTTGLNQPTRKGGSTLSDGRNERYPLSGPYFGLLVL